MLKKITSSLTNLLAIFQPRIKTCKICFQPITQLNPHNFLKNDCKICSSCEEKLVPRFHFFSIERCKALSLYDYDDVIKTMLYQLKGCYDIELAPIFIDRFKKELHIWFKGWLLVSAPSYIEDERKREFQHVIEIFKGLKLPFLELFIKTSSYKQSDHNAKERANIIKHIALSKKVDLYGKKIMIVDDVYTTGSTIKAMINLLKPLRPKEIRVLVMAKTKPK